MVYEAEATDVGPQSPFYPGTNIQWAWDATSLGWLKRCPRLYYYNMICGYRSKRESVHLKFGIEVHSSLEQYHSLRARGIDHEEAVFLVVKDLMIRTWGWDPDETERAGKYKNRRSLVRTVVDYLDHYYNNGQEDPAKTWIDQDGNAAVEQNFQWDLDWGPECSVEKDEDGDDVYKQVYVLCGHLDRVVTFNDELFIDDYKTTTMTPGEYYWRQFEPNNQMTMYSAAGKMVLRAPIKGVIIDAIQVMIDETRPVRRITYRTDGQIDEWIEGLKKWFALAEWYAEQEDYPMNDTACDGCDYQNVCNKDPDVREAFLKRDFVKGEQWNPLVPRT